MIRPLYTWLLFGLCLALVTAAMGWVSWTALRLDAAQTQAQRQAVHEENVRLALWRMDSTLALLVAQEGARPYFHYHAFYPAERAYNRMLEEMQPGEVRLASPLLTFSSPQIVLHFQLDPSGTLTSPQAPQDNISNRTKSGYVNPERVQSMEQELARIGRHLQRDALLAALPAPQQAPMPQVVQVLQQPEGLPPPPPQVPNQPDQQEASVQQFGQAAVQSDVQRQSPVALQQERKSSMEFSKRSGVNREIAQQTALANNAYLNEQAGWPAAVPAVSEGGLRPVWVHDLLLLARRVSANGGEYVQGCVLNWPVIRQSLLADISDLLPKASLVPLQVVNGDSRGLHMLASVPVGLEPGPTAEEPAPVASPVRSMLLVAWACLLLAVTAVGVLLRGAMTLSERRGAFVSAVTHELRTPLTTLRMYTEMLAEGMVRDEDKKRSYLQTLRAEADRLGHLVENVLAYSRIERGRARGHVVTLPVDELIERVRQRLAERAEQAGMLLIIEPAKDEACVVRADPSAVEQILFNLVDNASKYAASAADKSIYLETGRQNGKAFVRVRDHGPGISPRETGRLFRPFCKSAREAANTAPGVGLGLALSRRLAREMAGDLCLDRDRREGAAFVLLLPISTEP